MMLAFLYLQINNVVACSIFRDPYAKPLGQQSSNNNEWMDGVNSKACKNTQISDTGNQSFSVGFLACMIW